MATHRTDLKVRFSELDPYGHVNHAVYVSYLEVGRTEALDSIGLGLDHLAGIGWQFVVVELQMRFRRSAQAGDLLVVETTVGDLNAVSSRWRQRIVRGSEVLIDGEVRAAATDLSGKPKRMPPELLEQLRTLG
jgi:acyl-CoA thioester hydrolase